MIMLALSLFGTAFAYVIVAIFYLGRNRWPGTLHKPKALLVIAHPDDEAMFFGPSIRYFAGVGEVFVLCLTNGDFEGIGEVRSEELIKSCKHLQVPRDNVKIVENKALPDNPTYCWDVKDVADEVSTFVKTVQPDVILTFDQFGVSGHVNHIATSFGVKYAFRHNMLPEQCTLYELSTVNLIRKYSSFMDCYISSLSNIYSIASLGDVVRINSAMKAHRSQLVWFRRLYVMFSRYMVVNTFKSVLD